MDLERRLGNAGDAFRRAGLQSTGFTTRAGVSHRISHRTVLISRQPLCLPADLLLLQGALPVPTPRPFLGRVGGPGNALDDDLCRGHADQPIPLDYLYFWRLPDLYRPENVQAGRDRYPAGSEPGGAIGYAFLAHHPLLRQEALLYES